MTRGNVALWPKTLIWLNLLVTLGRFPWLIRRRLSSLLAVLMEVACVSSDELHVPTVGVTGHERDAQEHVACVPRAAWHALPSVSSGAGT